ncbi:putative leucine-rich repeat-containing protein DDB_G0290503 [Prorops nasuta]|uniref:putative leucine-rich repeat-containing protein DDB_G0290503 n=1 Tax=Prorops nasuta TaxID=863751 RepID=UPI0034CDED4C
MTTLNKQKQGELLFEDDDSSKHRRSSLAVNLSNDSGNGSLKRTQLDSNKTVYLNNKKSLSRQDVSERASPYQNRMLRNQKNKVINVKSSENLNSELIDIKHKEESLNNTLEQLKIAILNKTKSLFDQDNELLIKTSMILDSVQSDQCLHKRINEPLKGQREKQKITTLKGDIMEGNNTIQILTSTPKTNNNNSGSKKKSMLQRKRLFSNENTTHPDISKKTNNLFTVDRVLRSSNSKHSITIGSPILSGSNRENYKLTIPNRTSLHVKAKQNKFSTPISSAKPYALKALSKISSTLGNENTFQETPIKCLAYLKESKKTTEKGAAHSSYSIKNIDEKEADMKTINKAISMELTNIENNFLSNDVAKITNNAPSNIKTPAALKIQQDVILKKKITILKTGHNKNNVIKIKNSRRNNDISLKVNTSIDTMQEDDSMSAKEIALKENVTNLNNVLQNENSEEERIDSSLDVNTSVDSIHMQTVNNCNTKTKVSEDQIQEPNTPSQENVPISKRLRSISIHRNMNNSHQEITKSNSFNGIHDKLHEGKLIEGPSFVEPTPYPTSRSTFFLSRLKSETHLNMAKDSQCLHPISSMNLLKETNKPFSQSKVDNLKHNTIILGDSFTQSAANSMQPSVIIADSTNESEDKNSQENYPKKGNRRKLFSLRSNSQLVSLTPMQEKSLSPKAPTIRKRFRNLSKPVKNNIKLNLRSNSKRNLEDFSSLENLEIDLKLLGKTKKDRKPRKIVSKKIVIKKFAKPDLLEEITADRSRNNRSAKSTEDDFKKNKNIPTQSWHKRKSEKIVVVTTGLSKGDKALVTSVVKHLGSAKIDQNVTKQTTHVISSGVRTINLLFGIIRGCWLLSLEWVLKSLENEEWIDPKPYELAHFSKAVTENRRDRQLFGKAFVPELFATCGLIYVQNQTTPPCDVLKNLIKVAGGRITESAQNSKIIVGKDGIKETWIIDSITTGDLQPIDSYRQK